MSHRVEEKEARRAARKRAEVEAARAARSRRRVRHAGYGAVGLIALVLVGSAVPDLDACGGSDLRRGSR